MTNRQFSLNRKQRLYVEGVAAGRRRAALDASYSLSSANNPGRVLSHHDPNNYFQLTQNVPSTEPAEKHFITPQRVDK